MTTEANKMPDWEVAMKVLIPNGPKKGRPRRMSLHTIAALCGRENILELAKEMQEAKYPDAIKDENGIVINEITDYQPEIRKQYRKVLNGLPKVSGYRCPDVNCLIFYLKEHVGRPTMIDTPDPDVWSQVEHFCLVEAPYPAIKGFKRFPEGRWEDENGNPTPYGVGRYVEAKYGMSFPFEPEDFPYAREVIKALTEAGYTPGLEIPDQDPETPVAGCTLGCCPA